MNSKQSFNRKMYQLVLNILTFFSGVWSGIASVASVVTSFTDNVTEIDETITAQQTSIKSYNINKKKRKREMADIALTLRGKLSAFAAAAGDTILLGKLKISFTKLFRAKDLVAIANAEIILDAANGLTAAQKTSADITEAEITALGDSISVFRNLPTPDK